MREADCTVVVRNLINKHALTRCPVHLVLRVNEDVTLWYPALHEEQVRTLKSEPMDGRRGTGWRRMKSWGRNVENVADMD